MPAQIFENRVAVVTGASSGIGRATAELFASRGARVAVFARSEEKLRELVARRGGVIVNVASISGVIGPEKFPRFVSYDASKAAVIALTEALAVEVKGYGIRVNCLSPGSVDTKMWDEASGGAPASMTAEEIAEVISFLASDQSRPMNGQNVDVYSA